MKDVLDVHTHTIASGHAFNTMMEMIQAAQEKGLAVYGITEHAPMMPGTCQEFYFHNLKIVDRQYGDLRVLLGVELNILDRHGKVDLQEPYLGQMDVAIASLHVPCIQSGGKEWNTRCVIETMQNPHINIIGHPDDGRYPLDYEAVVRAAKEYRTLLEVNNHSLEPDAFRRNARENVLEMLKWCRKLEVPVILGSDAHYYKDILNHVQAIAVLEEADFPEDLVVNTDPEKLYGYINGGKRFTSQF